MRSRPHCHACLLIASVLIFASPQQGGAQTCVDYSRYFHWLSRVDIPSPLVRAEIRPPYGYLTDEVQGLRVFDLTDPLHPQPLGEVALPGQPWEVCLYGNHACVSVFSQGLQVVDVSDPVHPSIAGSLWTQSAIGVATSGSYAYMTDFFSSRLYTISLMDPANPEIVAELQVPGWAWDVAITGKQAVVTAAYSVIIVDISNPLAPRRLGAVDVADAVYDIALDGHYAYIAGVSGLIVVDFEDPIHPSVVAEVSVSSVQTTILFKDGFVFLGRRENGVTVFNVRNPAQPVEVAHLPVHGWTEATGLATIGDLLYVVNPEYGLQIADAKNPMAVQPIATLQTPSSLLYFSIAEPLVYVAAVEVGLLVVDLSDPTEPRQLSLTDISGFTWEIEHADGLVYLACDAPGLRVFDVADPREPVLIGSADTGGRAVGIDVEGGFAYVLDESRGLRVVDVSDPTNPIPLGTLPTTANRLTALGDFVYLAGTYGLKIVDVSDPTQPYVVESMDLGFSLRSMTGDRDHLYVGGAGQEHRGIVASLGLADPVHPLVLDQVSTMERTRAMELHGNFVWLSEEEGLPVLVLDVSRPEDMQIVGLVDLAERMGDVVWDLGVTDRYAIGGNGGNGRVYVIPCNVPIAPSSADGGPVPPPMGRGSALVCEPGANVRLCFDPSVRAAEVEIVDIAGRIIRRLALDGPLGDPMQVTWDMRSSLGHLAAPGVYFARVPDGRRREARRLIVVP